VSCQDQGDVLEPGQISKGSQWFHQRKFLIRAKTLFQLNDTSDELVMILSADRSQLLETLEDITGKSPGWPGLIAGGGWVLIGGPLPRLQNCLCLLTIDGAILDQAIDSGMQA
jgi:hypothetical protein